MDTKNVLDPWLSGNWEDDVNKGKKSSGVSLGERIRDKNKKYISDLQAELDAANADTLKSIKIDDKYEKETRGLLNTALKEREKELTETSAEVQDIREQIGKATSSADIEDIGTGEIGRLYGEKARKEISGLLADKRGEFKSAEEEFRESLTPRISGATLGELISMEREAKDAPTVPLEKELLRQIDARREELS